MAPSMEKPLDTAMVEVDEDIKAVSLDPNHPDTRPDILRSLSHHEMQFLEKNLVRKLDIRILPILILLFLLNILDRNAIANARLGSLEEDIGITDSQYQNAIMILWAGYVSMMIPSNMLLSIFKPRIYLPTVVIIWGVVSGCSGFVQNYAGIMVCRFLVGVTEAPYFPGCIFFLSCWYKREELPFRISIFYSGYTLSSAFGGLIAAGIIGNMDGVAGYASWRWLFLIEGGATILAAVPAFWLLPNYPATTMWLSAEERAVATYRLSLEADGEEDTVKGSVMKGLKEALLDPKVWLLVLIQSAAVMAMSFTYFFPSIVQTLGYPRVITLLITSPPYFAAFFFSLANSYHSSKSNERGYHIIGAVLMAAVGQIIAFSTPNVGARLFAFHLCAMGAFSAFQVILSWVSSSIPRPKAKRAVSIALATAVSNCLNIASSYLYPKSDAPMYRTGGLVLMAACLVCATAGGILKFWLWKLNKKAETKDQEQSYGHQSFRYVL